MMRVQAVRLCENGCSGSALTSGKGARAHSQIEIRLLKHGHLVPRDEEEKGSLWVLDDGRDRASHVHCRLVRGLKQRA